MKRLNQYKIFMLYQYNPIVKTQIPCANMLPSRIIALHYAIKKHSKRGTDLNTLDNDYIICCLNRALKQVSGNVALTRIFKGVRACYYLAN